MKRSLVIEFIVSRLVRFEDDRDLTYTQHATKILDGLEEAGMLPPDFTRHYGKGDFSVVNQWEPEDE